MSVPTARASVCRPVPQVVQPDGRKAAAGDEPVESESQFGCRVPKLLTGISAASTARSVQSSRGFVFVRRRTAFS
jgi:hypothetical protein